MGQAEEIRARALGANKNFQNMGRGISSNQLSLGQRILQNKGTLANLGLPVNGLSDGSMLKPTTISNVLYGAPGTAKNQFNTELALAMPGADNLSSNIADSLNAPREMGMGYTAPAVDTTQSPASRGIAPIAPSAQNPDGLGAANNYGGTLEANPYSREAMDYGDAYFDSASGQYRTKDLIGTDGLANPSDMTYGQRIDNGEDLTRKDYLTERRGDAMGQTDWAGYGQALMGVGQLGLGVASYMDNAKTANLQRKLLGQQYDNNAAEIQRTNQVRSAAAKGLGLPQ